MKKTMAVGIISFLLIAACSTIHTNSVQDSITGTWFFANEESEVYYPLIYTIYHQTGNEYHFYEQNSGPIDFTFSEGKGFISVSDSEFSLSVKNGELQMMFKKWNSVSPILTGEKILFEDSTDPFLGKYLLVKQEDRENYDNAQCITIAKTSRRYLLMIDTGVMSIGKKANNSVLFVPDRYDTSTTLTYQNDERIFSWNNSGRVIDFVGIPLKDYGDPHGMAGYWQNISNKNSDILIYYARSDIYVSIIQNPARLNELAIWNGTFLEIEMYKSKLYATAEGDIMLVKEINEEKEERTSKYRRIRN